MQILLLSVLLKTEVGVQLPYSRYTHINFYGTNHSKIGAPETATINYEKGLTGHFIQSRIRVELKVLPAFGNVIDIILENIIIVQKVLPL
mgnify:CR=1 FL=1